MREESHLDDMRAAIRGDFARLKERIGDQALLVAEGADEVDATPGQEPPAQAEAQAPEAPPQAVVESDPDPDLDLEAPAGEVEVVEPVVGSQSPSPKPSSNRTRRPPRPKWSPSRTSRRRLAPGSIACSAAGSARQL